MKAQSVRTRRSPPKMARTDAMSVEPGGWVGVPGCCLLLFCIWVTTSFNCSDRRVWFQKGTTVALPLSSSISNEQRFLRSHAFTQSCNKFSAVLFHNLSLQTAMFCNNSLAFLRTKLCVFSRSDDKLRSGFVLKACAGHCAQCAQCAQTHVRPPQRPTADWELHSWSRLSLSLSTPSHFC